MWAVAVTEMATWEPGRAALASPNAFAASFRASARDCVVARTVFANFAFLASFSPDDFADKYQANAPAMAASSVREMVATPNHHDKASTVSNDMLLNSVVCRCIIVGRDCHIFARKSLFWREREEQRRRATQRHRV